MLDSQNLLEEKLVIKNFFSISNLEWKPRKYNIITGEMGSGKSLCLKLLYFIYEIFRITFVNNLSINIFKSGNFYSILNTTFKEIFSINESCSSDIFYTIESPNKQKKFDFCTFIRNGVIEFRSEYITEKLEEWQKKAEKLLQNNSLDSVEYLQKYIFNDISSDIGDAFPFGQLYFSDLRVLLTEPNNVITTDYLTNALLSIRSFFEHSFKTWISEAYSKENAENEKNKVIKKIIKTSYNILNIQDILFEINDIYLIHKDGRKTPLNKCSSGQRELFHLLSFVNLIQIVGSSYGKSNVLFIEEPEAHLFPKEQKLFLELLGLVCNYINSENLKWRFYITTHSPYFLNVFNNMLFKGIVLNKHKNNFEKIKEINEAIPFADFQQEQVSGIFLENKNNSGFIGVNLLQEDEESPFFFSRKTEEITLKINDDYNALSYFFAQDF